ncbi:hypothetical protein THAOC_33265, partial [Thalassiosira oceanica]
MFSAQQLAQPERHYSRIVSSPTLGLDSAETSMPGITITLHTRPQTQQRNAVASASKLWYVLCLDSSEMGYYFKATVKLTVDDSSLFSQEDGFLGFAHSRHSTSCFCYYDAAVAGLGSNLAGGIQILDSYNLHGGNDNSGICVLLVDDHAASNQYGPTLVTEGFDDEGTHESFSFEIDGTLNQLEMYCRRGVTSVTLPPFVGSIQHAICTFGENDPNTIDVSPINEGGICIFIGGHQRDEWGPSLTSLGWIDEGLPDGFGYPNPLALYCQYELADAADIQLPPFHDFGDNSWGINHGICTFGNLDAIPSVSDSSLTYERVEISSVNEPVQMWGDNTAYQVSGFESTPCQTFYRSSLTNAPHNAETTLINSAFCVMSVDKNIPAVVTWQESLESQEYGFTRLEPIEGLYIRLNAGDYVGATNSLSMHCKYDEASATLPPFPPGVYRQVEMGLCAFGYDSVTVTKM